MKENKFTPTISQNTPDPDLLAQEKFGIPFLMPYQKVVIDNILAAAGVYGKETATEHTGRNIILLPTGYGKSLCFMLPAFILEGITIVVFPLLSLIADQKRRCDEAGLSSAAITGTTPADQREKIRKQLQQNKIRIILSNPETLNTLAEKEFFKEAKVSHIVVDESHTISEWGDTFRSALLETGSTAEKIGAEVISCFTATASELIIGRIKETVFFNREVYLISANPDRDNISYHLIRTFDRYRILEKILNGTLTAGKDKHIELQKPLIFFCRNRAKTEKTAWWIKKHFPGEEVYFYHAGLPDEKKKEVEDKFYESDCGILVTTCAYGMGVDKKNIRSVVHIGIPETAESFLQESGRGGRDREPAESLLIIDYSDIIRISSAVKNPDNFQNSKFLKLCRIMFNDNIFCRRDTLLSTLNEEAEKCCGCDICSNEYQGLKFRNFIKNALKIRKYIIRNSIKKLLSDRLNNGASIFSEKYPEEDLEALFKTLKSLKFHKTLILRKKF